MVATLINEGVFTLAEFADMLGERDDDNSGGDNGGDDGVAAGPREDFHLLGETLRGLVATVGEDKVKELWAEAAIDLAARLPEARRTEADLLRFAAQHGVTFLFALRAMKQELAAVLTEHLSCE
jgi:hypothetical protein